MSDSTANLEICVTLKHPMIADGVLSGGKYHRWQTAYSDTEVDFFATEYGHHNGPRCLDCGRSGCEHCDLGIYQEECPAHVK